MISGMDQVTKQYRLTTVYVETPPVKSLGVSPKDISVPLGATVEVTATVAFHGGGEMKANESVKWTPDKPNVAVITAGGSSVKGTAVESTLIEVLEPLSGQTDFINVTVLPPVPTMILISPTGPTFRVGDKPQFSASGSLLRRDQQGPGQTDLGFFETAAYSRSTHLATRSQRATALRGSPVRTGRAARRSRSTSKCCPEPVAPQARRLTVPARSMQLDVRLGAPRDQARERVERDLREAVQRQLVHLVERHVHERGRSSLRSSGCRRPGRPSCCRRC